MTILALDFGGTKHTAGDRGERCNPMERQGAGVFADRMQMPGTTWTPCWRWGGSCWQGAKPLRLG